MSQQFASRREILQNWNPEDKGFWESYGKIIAKENLIVSTAALTLDFCVWYLWSTVASQLNSVGFNFTKDQLFTLAALPGLVGATSAFSSPICQLGWAVRTSPSFPPSSSCYQLSA